MRFLGHITHQKLRQKHPRRSHSKAPDETNLSTCLCAGVKERPEHVTKCSRPVNTIPYSACYSPLKPAPQVSLVNCSQLVPFQSEITLSKGYVAHTDILSVSKLLLYIILILGYIMAFCETLGMKNELLTMLSGGVLNPQHRLNLY